MASMLIAISQTRTGNTRLFESSGLKGNQPGISIHCASHFGSKFANSRRITQKRWMVHASDQGAGNGLEENIVTPGSTVLVAGATGGVGQLLSAKLLERGYKVRALSRSQDKTRAILGNAPNLDVVYGDMRDETTLGAAVEGVDAVCCCTGTTAFPSARWKGGNDPKQTDYVAVRNLLKATPKTIKRFVLTTSAGVERSDSFPFLILNAFGVLKYKRMAEEMLEDSGLPYTIIRPNRLTDGPYTSYDLNTVLKGVSGERQDVLLTLQDDQVGETSRIVVAESIVQSLQCPETINLTFSIGSRKGSGPEKDGQKWRALFQSLTF